MQKLILTYRTGSGEPCGGYYLSVLPLEYESLEQWIIDFEIAFKDMISHTLANTYPAPTIHIPGSHVNLMDSFLEIYSYGFAKYHTFEEFMEANDMQIADLDTWFEHKKGNTIWSTIKNK